MSDRLHIGNEMRQLDLKNRDFYDDLTAEEQKKFSTFLMIRWSSAVQVGNSPRDKNIEQYYLQSCNENLNKHFFDIGRHPKLQWLCATTVSPGQGTWQHSWIRPKKKEAGASGIKKQLMEIYPNMKDDEIELMSKLNTKKDIDAYLKLLGQEIKK